MRVLHGLHELSVDALLGHLREVDPERLRALRGESLELRDELHHRRVAARFYLRERGGRGLLGLLRESRTRVELRDAAVACLYDSDHFLPFINMHLTFALAASSSPT